MSATTKTTAIKPTTPIAIPAYGSNVKDTKGNIVGQAKFDPNTGKALDVPKSTPAAAPPAYNAQTGATTGKPSAAYDDWLRSLNKVSSTTLSTSNKGDQVKKNASHIEELSKRGSSVDAYGNSINAAGNIEEEEETDTGEQELQKADTSEQDKQSEALMKTMQKDSDAITAQSIGISQNLFAQRKQEQAKINERAEKGTQNALLMGGVTGQGSSAQYAPISSGGTVQAQESYGLQQIADLDFQEQSLIMEAKQAGLQNNFRIAEKKMEEIDKVRQEKIDATAELNKTIIANNAKIREQNIQYDRDEAISKIYNSGITDTKGVADALRNQGIKATTKEVSDTVALLTGEGGDGEVGYYNDLAKQYREKGLIPPPDLRLKAHQQWAAAGRKGESSGGGGTSIASLGGKTSEGAKKALQVILGSGKFTKDQKADVVAAINGGADPFTVVKNQAKNIMSGANQTKLEAAETARDAFDTLAQSIQEFYDKGGKTSYVSGNFEKMANRFGSVNDPALVDLAVQIQGNIQSYRNAISGTAYSEQEGRDIASIFPGINKSEGLNSAITNGRKKLFDQTIDATYRSTLGSSYDELKNQVAEKEKNDGDIVTSENAKKAVNVFILTMPNDPDAIKAVGLAKKGVSQDEIYELLKLRGKIK